MLIAVFLAAAVVTDGSPTPADTAERAERKVTLGPAAMFRLAERASAAGDTRMVAAIYRALEQDANAEVRAEARFRHAKLMILQKRNRDAALLLRRLLDDKPEAAGVRLELAWQLQLLGDADAALREVRAVQASGLPPAVARLVDRYSEALRASRPFGASFEFALAPDSNPNRATRSDTLGTIFGEFDIDEGSKATSGTGVALRGQTYRRFSLGGDDFNLLVKLSGSADLYKTSRFNDVASDLAVGPEMQFGENQINVEAGTTLRWFGQKPFMRSVRVGTTVVRPIGRRSQLRLSGTAAIVDNLVNDFQDGKVYAGEFSVERALTETTGIALTGSVARQSLKDAGYSTTGWRFGMLGWHELGRVTLTASAETGRLHADERLSLFPDKRSDRYSRLSLGMTFRRLSFGGLAPVVRYTLERNRSSIAFYDYRRRRTEVGFARAF